MDREKRRGRLYTYRYTVATRMTPALRRAAMRAIFMFHNCEGQSHKTVSTDHNFWSETRAEADSNRGPSAYQPNALPLGQTGSPPIHCVSFPFQAAPTPLFNNWTLSAARSTRNSGRIASYRFLVSRYSRAAGISF